MNVIELNAEELRVGDILRREQIKRPYKNIYLYDHRDVRVLDIRPGLTLASVFVDLEDLQDGYQTHEEFFKVNRRSIERGEPNR